MAHILIRLTSAGIVAGALACSVGAQSAKALKTIRELNANYAAITAAFVRKDIDALSQFLSPGFSARDAGGHLITRNAVIEDFRRQMNSISKPTWVRQVTKLKEKPGFAKVVVSGVFKGKMVGDDRRTHVVQMNALAEDEWARVGGKWLLRSTYVASRKMFIDGKPLDMAKK